MGPLQMQSQRLSDRWKFAELKDVPGGLLVTIPDFPLSPGWNKAATVVHFLAPTGYPFAKPDSFWTEGDLRLASGAMPQNTQLNNPVPGTSHACLWFSWHMEHWNPSRDDLLTWVASVKARMFKSV